jgi:hypothetical protein
MRRLATAIERLNGRIREDNLAPAFVEMEPFIAVSASRQ